MTKHSNLSSPSGQDCQGLTHDGQDVVQALPGLGQLEHAEQPEGPQHGQARDAVGQELDQRQDHNEEVKAVPAILKIINIIILQALYYHILFFKKVKVSMYNVSE